MAVLAQAEDVLAQSDVALGVGAAIAEVVANAGASALAVALVVVWPEGCPAQVRQRAFINTSASEGGARSQLLELCLGQLATWVATQRMHIGRGAVHGLGA